MRAIMLGIVASGLAMSVAFADEAAKSFGLCPVSGAPAKEDVTMDYKGKKIHFCCEGCPDKVKADPKAFTAKINHQLLVTGQLVQVGCPFTGGAVNEKTVVELDGAKFGFCCNNCKGKFEKSDNKVEMVFGKIDKGFTLQEKCPVSGKPINPKVKTAFKGKNVYFCCGGCPKSFEANPEKFTEKLPKEEEEGKGGE